MRAIAGPLMPEEDFARSQRAPRNVELIRSVPDLAQELRHAAASISQCGYNTALDLVRTRVPALVVPYATPEEDEQEWLRDRSPSSCRTRSCSPAPSGDNIAYGTDATEAEIVDAARRPPPPTTSSSACRTATTRSSGPRERGSPAASASAWASPARCCATRRSSSSTSRRRRSTQDAEGQVMEGLDRLMRGRTCILITHSARLACYRRPDPRTRPRTDHGGPLG